MTTPLVGRTFLTVLLACGALAPAQAAPVLGQARGSGAALAARFAGLGWRDSLSVSALRLKLINRGRTKADGDMLQAPAH